MLDRDEIAHSLIGAWRLFLDKPDALRFFDFSVGGFWRSFGTIVLIAPIYVLTIMGLQEMDPRASPRAHRFPQVLYFVDRLIALLLGWVTLPAVLACLARPLGFAATYGSFVVARNWCAVLEMIPFALIALLSGAGIAGAEAVSLLLLAALVVILRFDFIIARRALAASIGLAAGVVALDFVLGLFISAGVDAVFGL